MKSNKNINICNVQRLLLLFDVGPLKIVLTFANLIITPLISESLLGYPVTMAILQKCLGTFSS